LNRRFFMQIKHRYLTLLYCLLLYGNIQSNFISYILNSGRFGDHLLTYAKTKWFAYQYNIPLLYVPFKYSDQLGMHTLEKMRSSNNLIKGMTILPLTPKTLIKNSTDNILYLAQLNTKKDKITCIDNL